MLKCFDHKTTFPDTHRLSCLATEISKTNPIFSGGQELKRSSCLNKCSDLQPMDAALKLFDFQEKHPICKQKGYRMHNSALSLHPGCAFNRPC